MKKKADTSRIAKDPVVYVSMTKDGHYALEQLLAAGKRIDLVVTLPKEKSAGVSDYIDFAPLARAHQVPLRRALDINKDKAFFQALRPRVIIVNGWSQILRAPLRATARHGCVGTHPALLPKNRGRAPIAWHFINEEKRGGVTLFYLDDGCDSGPIIDQASCLLRSSDNALSYYQKITELGAALLLKNYDKIATGSAKSRPQDARRATYLLKRRPQDSFLDFSKTARRIHNQIRSVSGVYPPAFFKYQGREYRALHAELLSTPMYSGVPGQIAKVTDGGLWVLSSDQIIVLGAIHDQQNRPIKCSEVFRIGYVINE